MLRIMLIHGVEEEITYKVVRLDDLGCSFKKKQNVLFTEKEAWWCKSRLKMGFQNRV